MKESKFNTGPFIFPYSKTPNPVQITPPIQIFDFVNFTITHPKSRLKIVV